MAYPDSSSPQTMNQNSATIIEAQRLDRIVAVMTYVRAGTSLISSLLDNHPNVLSTPDCVLMGFYEFWDNHGHLPARRLASSFIDYYAVLFDARAGCKCPRIGPVIGEYENWTQLGPQRDECMTVDRESFERIIIRIIGDNGPVSRKLFFQALHIAYAEAQGRKVKDPIIAFGLHISKPESVQALVEDFPEAVFLHMVRDPILGCGSQFRHNYLQGRVSPTTGMASITAAHYRGSFRIMEDRTRWRAVRLEDLHGSPRQTLQKICDWLEMPWDDALLTSTINGKKWWNEKNTLQVSGFSDSIVSQTFNEYLTAFDRFRLNALFARKSETWGYQPHPWFSSVAAKLLFLLLLAIPFKMELMSISFVGASSLSSPSLGRRLLATVQALYLGRKRLLGMWLATLRKRHKEVELLYSQVTP